MAEFKVISDSSCDLPDSIIKELDIDIVPFYVSFDNEEYFKEGKDICPDEFYKKTMEYNLFPKTSLPTIKDYMDAFEKHLKAGYDVICICLTDKFSGSYQSAVNAKEAILAQYPKARIEVINSIQATGGQGMVVYEAGLMAKEGVSFEAACEKIEKLKETARVNFTVDNLDSLSRGGRVGKASALAGNILNIKPVICVKSGELIPVNKVRGRKKALREIVSLTLADVDDEKENYHYCLLDTVRPKDIEEVKELLGEFGIKPLMPVFRVGVTIGSHVGPTAVGIAYIRKYDA